MQLSDSVKNVPSVFRNRSMCDIMDTQTIEAIREEYIDNVDLKMLILRPDNAQMLGIIVHNLVQSVMVGEILFDHNVSMKWKYNTNNKVSGIMKRLDRKLKEMKDWCNEDIRDYVWGMYTLFGLDATYTNDDMSLLGGMFANTLRYCRDNDITTFVRSVTGRGIYSTMGEIDGYGKDTIYELKTGMPHQQDLLQVLAYYIMLEVNDEQAYNTIKRVQVYYARTGLLVSLDIKDITENTLNNMKALMK